MLPILLQGLCDLLWPGRAACCLCRAPAPASPDPLPVCAGCLEQGDFPPGLPQCRGCSRPLDGPWSLCPDCTAGVPFAGAVALGLHRPPLDRAVGLLKYQRRPQVALPLGRALGARVRGCWPALPFAAVVPLPLHRARQAERGYNQAQELAAALAKELALPMQPTWLRRVRPTRQQARLNRAARLENLQGAFRAEVPVPPPVCVLLVDDVLTTGATASAAAQALKAAGVHRIALAVISVSPKPVW